MPRRPTAPLPSHPSPASFLRALSKQFRWQATHRIPREHLDADAFFERYYFRNAPVIVRGLMKDWPALERWTPEYFVHRFGRHRVEICAARLADPHYESNFQAHRRTVLLRDFVQMIRERGASNDCYLSARNFFFRRNAFKPLLRDLRCPAGFLAPRTFRSSANLFFGPAGTVTPLHFDGCNVLFGQIYGRKHFKLIPPFDAPHLYAERICFSAADLERVNYAKFPMLRDASILEAVVEPGEFLFLPMGWYHWVKALNVSISVSFTEFRVKGGPLAWRFWE